MATTQETPHEPNTTTTDATTTNATRTADVTATDVIVIGAGPTGENIGQYAHDGVLDVVLVDVDLFGGECSYYACMPSKALLRPIDLVTTSRHLPGVTPTELDRDALLTRRDAWVSHYDDGQVSWAENAGLDMVRETPERLVIVGGGVVACEAATWMAALGSRVTMLVRGDRLLASFEPFAGEAVLTSLQDLGIEARFGTTVVDARRDEVFAGASDSPGDPLGKPHGGRVTLTLSRGEDATETYEYEARVLGARLAGREETAASGSVPVPQVVFTDPQVAAVGLTAAQARAAGHDIVTAEVPFASAAGSSLMRDDGVGRANLVVDAGRGVVLGATFVGHEAAELLHAATVAIVGQVPIGVLRHAVPAYPTASELWLRLLEELPATTR